MIKKFQHSNYKPFFYVAAAFVAYIIYKTAIAGKKLAVGVFDAVTGTLTNSAAQTIVNQAGITNVRISEVNKVTENIYNALHKDSLFGFFEDEEKAITEFNKLLNVNEAKAASRLYSEYFSKSLYQDMNKYVHGSGWRKLKSALIEAIKNV